MNAHAFHGSNQPGLAEFRGYQIEAEVHNIWQTTDTLVGKAPTFGGAFNENQDIDMTRTESSNDLLVNDAFASTVSTSKLSIIKDCNLGMDMRSGSSRIRHPRMPLQLQIQDSHDQFHNSTPTLHIIPEAPVEQQNLRADKARQPSRLDWFSNRHLIERLYASHTLEYVREEIKQHHGFHARYGSRSMLIT